jgi:prenyltransferase beta subunit
MLRAARRAPLHLGDSTKLVREFLLSRQNADGGFQGRTPQSDLYYTGFALDGLLALKEPVPTKPVARYLRSFGGGEALDFVHLCCLARCYSALRDAGMRKSCAVGIRREIRQRVEAHRSRDGGYRPRGEDSPGTLYAAFLAVGAYQDLGGRLPAGARLAESLKAMERTEGGWANESHVAIASTNSTAAALAVLGRLGRLRDLTGAGRWLLAQQHPLGGFRASPLAPLPDLLSTATALHVLAGIGMELGPLREPCLDFIDSLWSNRGSFHGHWADEQLDVEYTFYGLLALGHLGSK